MGAMEQTRSTEPTEQTPQSGLPTGSGRGAGNRTRGENIPAIERATGRAWSEWLRFFDQHKASGLPHPEIARLARGEMPAELQNPDWWAQGVAIAFEQHAGLRVPGQSSTGTFRVSASRTVPFDRDAAVEAWRERHGGLPAHLGHAVEKPRTSRTEKRSFWRFSLDGAGKVEVAAIDKGDGRASVTVGHDGIPDGEAIEEWRAHWKGLLSEL